MEFGFTSWFSRTVPLDRAFRYLSAAGCTKVEVAAMPAYLSRARSIAASARRNGLEVTAISLGPPFLQDPGLDLHSKDRARARESIDYVRAAIEFASVLGAGVVYVCSIRQESQSSRTDARKRLHESLKRSSEHAERSGIVLALEPFPGGEVPRFDLACEIAAGVGSKSFGVLLDTGHLAISNEPIDKAVALSGRVLKHVHVNNNDGLADLHWPPQRGKLRSEDFRSFFRELSKTGYDGCTSVELANPRPIARTITESLDYLRGVVGGRDRD